MRALILDSSNQLTTASYDGRSALSELGVLPLGKDANGEIGIKTLSTGVQINNSTTAATQAQGVKLVTTAGTPVRLVATTTLVDSVLIQARKSRNSANTGDIFYGFSNTAANNYIALLAGQSISLQAPEGKKIDLNLIYIDAADSGDGVVYSSLN